MKTVIVISTLFSLSGHAQNQWAAPAFTGYMNAGIPLAPEHEVITAGSAYLENSPFFSTSIPFENALFSARSSFAQLFTTMENEHWESPGFNQGDMTPYPSPFLTSLFNSGRSLYRDVGPNVPRQYLRTLRPYSKKSKVASKRPTTTTNTIEVTVKETSAPTKDKPTPEKTEVESIPTTIQITQTAPPPRKNPAMEELDASALMADPPPPSPKPKEKKWDASALMTDPPPPSPKPKEKEWNASSLMADPPSPATEEETPAMPATIRLNEKKTTPASAIENVSERLQESINGVEQSRGEARVALEKLVKGNALIPTQKATMDEIKKIEELRQIAREKAAMAEKYGRQLMKDLSTLPHGFNEDTVGMLQESAELTMEYARSIQDAITRSQAYQSASWQDTQPKAQAKSATLDEMVKEMAKHWDAPNSSIEPPTLPPCSQSQSLDEEHQQKWNPGCKALGNRPIPEAQWSTLFDQCLSSLLEKILEGQGSPPDLQSLRREPMFQKMLNERALNPEEQRFLAMVLTSFGETRGRLKQYKAAGEQSRQERLRYQRVMKVIDNRTDKNQSILERKGSTMALTPMDTILTPWQFSPYNPRDPNLLKMLRYNDSKYRSQSMKNAVLAYIRYENKDRQVPDISDQIYHFVSHGYRKKTMNDDSKWYHKQNPIDPPSDIHHAFFELKNNQFPYPYRNNKWDRGAASAFIRYFSLGLYALR